LSTTRPSAITAAASKTSSGSCPCAAQLAVPQPICEQPPADPDPVLTPHELSPVQFPLTPPADSDQPSPSEPTVAAEPIETKDNPPADQTLHTLTVAPAEPELTTDN